MSWLYGYYFKEGKTDHAPLRPYLHSFESAKLGVYAGGSGKSLLSFPHPHHPDETVFILGDPILRMDTDFRYPVYDDWQRLLSNEELLGYMDGHWLILIAGNQEIRAYNDALCKRSLYLHESSDHYFFCSDISLLKDAGLATLDPAKFGVYWHTQFPPHLRRYGPSRHCCYSDVEMLYQRGRLILGSNGAKFSFQSFSPTAEVQDLHKLLENMTLLPLRAGRKVCLGLSGGMDARTLLAIMLHSKLPFTAVHFGKDDGADYCIAKRITDDFGIPFRFIPESSVDTGWESAVKYLYERGFGYNPASSCLMQYFPILAEDFDVFLGGYYGEMFRCRMMAAHYYSLFELHGPDYHKFAKYMNLKPTCFFDPEINLILHKGFINSLKEVVAQMPSTKGMINPLWMDLLYVRYSPRSINMPDLCQMDDIINDHMPYLQASLLNQHWHYGAFAQLDEQLHRRMIRMHQPLLRNYPLALARHSAPYIWRPYAVKLIVSMKARREKNPPPSRNDVFLKAHKEQIMNLRYDSRVVQDSWLDHAKVDKIIDEYYKGNSSYMSALLGFVTYVLGK
ncbi:MAG: hypothetical protein PHF32_06365 [Candidatus Cloacimonetes bacterium]|nr:hypothetical protein [Candidatus Cloacimonadota bacterium]